MSRSKRRHSRFGVIAYSVGLSLILAAAILNVCLSKLSLQHLYLLPDFLVEPYEQAGELGVTLFFAGLGLLVILAGFLHMLILGKASRSSVSEEQTDADESAASSSQTKVAMDISSGNGLMVLETSKYLTKSRTARTGRR